MHYALTCSLPISTTTGSNATDVTVVEEDGKIVALHFCAANTAQFSTEVIQAETTLLQAAVKQLREYCAGQRKEFDVPLNPKGTDFQQKVWAELCRIPYGQTRSYGQVAAALGNARACRAVGMANNRNPISVFIPCHRVIGANGQLVGYGGGLPIKEHLLRLEKALH